MNIYDATEQAYKNGYAKGFEDGKKDGVRHGSWLKRNEGMEAWYECSFCHVCGSPQWKRCPVCETKMDQGEE